MNNNNFSLCNITIALFISLAFPLNSIKKNWTVMYCAGGLVTLEFRK